MSLREINYSIAAINNEINTQDLSEKKCEQLLKRIDQTIAQVTSEITKGTSGDTFSNELSQLNDLKGKVIAHVKVNSAQEPGSFPDHAAIKADIEKVQSETIPSEKKDEAAVILVFDDGTRAPLTQKQKEELTGASDFFRVLFTSGFIEAQLHELPLKEIDSKSFHHLLAAISNYEPQGEALTDTLYTAERLQLMPFSLIKEYIDQLEDTPQVEEVELLVNAVNIFLENPKTDNPEQQEFLNELQVLYLKLYFRIEDPNLKEQLMKTLLKLEHTPELALFLINESVGRMAQPPTEREMKFLMSLLDLILITSQSPKLEHKEFTKELPTHFLKFYLKTENAKLRSILLEFLNKLDLKTARLEITDGKPEDCAQFLQGLPKLRLIHIKPEKNMNIRKLYWYHDHKESYDRSLLLLTTVLPVIHKNSTLDLTGLEGLLTEEVFAEENTHIRGFTLSNLGDIEHLRRILEQLPAVNKLSLGELLIDGEIGNFEDEIFENFPLKPNITTLECSSFTLPFTKKTPNLRELNVTDALRLGFASEEFTTETLLDIFENLPHLEKLSLFSADALSDHFFEEVPPQPQVKELSLPGSHKLKHPQLNKFSNLESLNISLKSLDPEVLEGLPNLKNLTSWGDDGESVSDAFFLNMQKPNETVVSLDLRHSSKLTNAGLIAILEKFPNLTHLYLNGCPQITLEGLTALQGQYPNLKVLNLDKMVPERLAKEKFPNLVDLNDHREKIPFVEENLQLDAAMGEFFDKFKKRSLDFLQKNYLDYVEGKEPPMRYQ